MSRKIFSRQQQSGSLGVFVQATSGTQNGATGASLVLNTPSGTANGDLMVAIMLASSTQNSSFSAPAGWNAGPSNTQPPNFQVFYKTASSEPASRTFTFSRTNSLLSGVIITFKNAKWGGTFGSTRVAGGGTDITVNGGAVPFGEYYPIAAGGVVDGSTFFNAPTSYSAIFNDSTGSAPSFNVFWRGAVDNSTYTNAPSVTIPTNASTSAAIGAVYFYVVSTSLAELSATSESVGSAPSTLTISSSVTVVSGNGTFTTQSGVELSKNGGAYATSGTITAGDTFRIRATAPGSWNASSTHDAFVAGTRFRMTISTADFILITNTGASTYTVPQGVSNLAIAVVGGGGGGRTAVSGTNVGIGGAGGGAFAGINNLPVTPGEVLNITVGAGGTYSAAAGGNGGSSTVTRASNGQVILTAGGGTGKTTADSTGTAGGTASGIAGAILVNGSAGGPGANLGVRDSDASFGGCGGGAGTPLGAARAFNHYPDNDIDSGADRYFTSSADADPGSAGYGVVFESAYWYTTGRRCWDSSDISSHLTGNLYGGGGAGGAGNTAIVSSAGAGGQGCAVIMLNGKTFNGTYTLPPSTFTENVSLITSGAYNGGANSFSFSFSPGNTTVSTGPARRAYAVLMTGRYFLSTFGTDSVMLAPTNWWWTSTQWGDATTKTCYFTAAPYLTYNSTANVTVTANISGNTWSWVDYAVARHSGTAQQFSAGKTNYDASFSGSSATQIGSHSYTPFSVMYGVAAVYNSTGNISALSNVTTLYSNRGYFYYYRHANSGPAEVHNTINSAISGAAGIQIVFTGDPTDSVDNWSTP